MRRREFLSVVGAAAVWPFAVRAQQRRIIGFLSSVSPSSAARPVAAFQQGLQEEGFVSDQNLAMAAKTATSSVPIIFSSATDPVMLGLVSSLNRPGGNITGVYVMTNALEAKRLGLLSELISNASTIGVLVNPDTPGAESQRLQLQSAATALKRNVPILPARDERDIETAMVNFARLRTNALLVAADPFFFAHRELLVTLAARFAIPTMYEFREYVVGGGLISYGISLVDAYRQIGRYTGRILKGEKAADLPVMQPTTFELVINLKTAKALGLAIPSGVLAIADEVIE